MWVKIKTLWMKLFGREPKLTQEEIEQCIIKNIYRLSKMGKVQIYHGTLPALREAQSDLASIIYVIKVRTNIDMREDITFRQWFNEYLER